MRKTAILFCLSIMSMMVLVAQTQHVDIRLSSVYSEEYLNDLQVDNPQKIEYLNWLLDNSYTIVELGLEKCEQMPYLKHLDPVNKIFGDNVETVDPVDINIFMYSFERQYDKKVYYRIGNSGQAIVFESFKKLAANFKNYQDEN